MATYSVWLDEVPRLPASVFASTTGRVVVWGERRHEFDRAYGVLDNARLRSHLLDGVEVERVEVTSVAGGVVRFAGGSVAADLIIDATGAGVFSDPSRPTVAKAYQSAYGVMIDAIPDGAHIEPGAVTMMDFRPTESGGPTTFLYVVPTARGWLVEETELAARSPAPPALLRRRLVSRLGIDVVERAEAAGRTESVSIAMGGALPRFDRDVVPYGAAAGYVHPVTGYSITTSFGAADRVATAIVSGGDVGAAIWPEAARRSRALHDYGLDALVRLTPAQTRRFFDTFFDQPMDRWPAYLRTDTAPRDVAQVMRGVFGGVDWSTRTKLVAGNPVPLLRLLT